jgi:hypothetical protein
VNGQRLKPFIDMTDIDLTESSFTLLSSWAHYAQPMA